MDERYLTEPEVAEILRCSTSKVKRLRLNGELSFVKDRPVLISQADLAAYVEAKTVRAAQAPKPEQPKPLDNQAAREWALKLVMKPRRYRAPNK